MILQRVSRQTLIGSRGASVYLQFSHHKTQTITGLSARLWKRIVWRSLGWLRGSPLQPRAEMGKVARSTEWNMKSALLLYVCCNHLGGRWRDVWCKSSRSHSSPVAIARACTLPGLLHNQQGLNASRSRQINTLRVHVECLAGHVYFSQLRARERKRCCRRRTFLFARRGCELQTEGGAALWKDWILSLFLIGLVTRNLVGKWSSV
jgi:hypothetical protein